MDELIADYTAWLKENELPELSAEELRAEDAQAAGHYLTTEQREWLDQYEARWDTQQAIVDRLMAMRDDA